MLCGCFTRHAPMMLLLVAALSFGALGAIAQPQPAGEAVLLDGGLVRDRVEVSVTSLLPPLGGQEYVVWLRSADGTVVLRVDALQVDEAGSGFVGWSQPAGENLVARFSDVLVTLEAAGTPQLSPSGQIVLSGGVDQVVGSPIRRLFAQWPDARYGTPSLVGLRDNAWLLRGHAELLVAAASEGDLELAQRKAEHIANLIEGSQGSLYADHNGDGLLEDPGDGTGLLAYVQAAQGQAEQVAANSPAPLQVESALGLSAGLASVEQAVAFVRDASLGLLAVQSPDQLPEAGALVLDGANQLLNGSVVDGVPAAPDGAETAYQAATGLLRLTLAPAA